MYRELPLFCYSSHVTVEAFYDDVFEWARGLLTPGRAFILGVNGPQGAGKSTLTAALCSRFAATGVRALTVSVDDFYLTRAEQVALATRFPANPYLQQRGYPGTHDVALGAATLDALRGRTGVARIPRYDKSAFRGQGDRAGFVDVALPLDLIFVEGWLLGFTPGSSLPDVDDFLRAYSAWTSRLDGFLLLDPLDPRYVLDWRVEAEERMKAGGKPGMSTEEIRAYVAKFLPAYEAWLPELRAWNPVKGPILRRKIGKNRLPAV